MAENKNFEVIIVGGSYAGLSAGMSLGRSLRNVLIIDGGKPCNRQTPHSHNFITHDGEVPQQIAEAAKAQVLYYDTVRWYNGIAENAIKKQNGFEIMTGSGDVFTAKKLLFATGLTDVMPDIKGFAECWGISVLHCPYCHGFEVRAKTIGLLGNGDIGFEFGRLISQWSKKLVLFTNGPSTLNEAQAAKLESHNIPIVEKEIAAFEHENGYVQQIVFADGSNHSVDAIFARPAFEQHCRLPQQLGCSLTEHGFIKVNDFQQTDINGIYAAGDNTSMFRAVSIAVAAGTKAGAVINKEMIEEEF